MRKTKKKPGEKLDTTPEYDSTRAHGVVLEGIHKELKTISEGHSAITHSIDEVKSDLSIVKSELDTVKKAVMDNSHEIKALKTGQQELKSDISQLKTGQQKMGQKLDTAISNMDQRVTKLEAVR